MFGKLNNIAPFADIGAPARPAAIRRDEARGEQAAEITTENTLCGQRTPATC
jgi:hypothetical protein